jgi:hypothetical protein
LNQVVAAARDRVSSGMFPNRGSLISYLRAAGISPTLSSYIGATLYSDPGAALETPSLWEYGHLVDVNDSIEVVMHLLFLGITRSLAKDTVYPFISARKQWSSYVDRVNTLFSRAQKMNIYWVRPQPVGISGSFGGWVSENYLAYSRLSKYLGALTEDLPAVDQPYKDPDIAVQEMSAPQLHRWLLVRGMKVTKPNGQTRARKVDYVRTVLATGWRRRGDHPHVSVDYTAGMPLSLFENVVTSCHTMICAVMGVRGIPTQQEQGALLRDVKLYLSYDHIFHTWSIDSPENIELRRATYNVVADGIVLLGPRSERDQPINLDPTDSDEDNTDNDEEESDTGDEYELEEDDSSLSDESVPDAVPTGMVPGPVVETRSYRIPAVAKRNKINLIKLPPTMGRVGSYQHLSELGQKGEGAIQTMKPVVKKLGGIQRRDWATHVAKAWSSRRFSRSALAMAMEAHRENGEDSTVSPGDRDFLDRASQTFAEFLSEASSRDDADSSLLDLDADGWGSLVDVVCHGGDTQAQAKRMYYVYKSREMALTAIHLGTQPISAVMVKGGEHGGNPSWFGVVYVDQTGSLKILRIEAGDLVTSRCGAAFFRWRVVNEAEHGLDLGTDRLVYVDYCLLLPLTAQMDHDGLLITVYYLITYWWREMLADGSIGIYRP